MVAATIRELGIIEKIDARLDLNERKGGLVSHGRRVAAMVLNGLGFMNSRLSMPPHLALFYMVVMMSSLQTARRCQRMVIQNRIALT